MLLCVEGTYFEGVPVPKPEGPVEVHLDDAKKRLYITVGNKRVEFGPKFFTWGGNCKICAISGKIDGNLTKSDRFRVIFEGNHYDFR